MDEHPRPRDVTSSLHHRGRPRQGRRPAGSSPIYMETWTSGQAERGDLDSASGDLERLERIARLRVRETRDERDHRPVCDAAPIHSRSPLTPLTLSFPQKGLCKKLAPRIHDLAGRVTVPELCGTCGGRLRLDAPIPPGAFLPDPYPRSHLYLHQSL